MTYDEALKQLATGKHAWRPALTGWPPKAYIKQHGSSLVIVDPSDKVYAPSTEDKAARDWEVGLHHTLEKVQFKGEEEGMPKEVFNDGRTVTWDEDITKG